MSRGPSDPDDRIVGAIYDALDDGDPGLALATARAALRDLGDDPVLHFLAGIALLDSDRPSEAVGSFERAVELDPDDAEFRANLALALFRCCRFEESEREADRALETDPGLPDAHHTKALAAERRGALDEADGHFARATRIDPERFPAPARMTREAFEAEIVRAGTLLPEEFRRHLDEVAVTVDEIPADEVLFDGSPPLDPELLGLFVGTALPDRLHHGVVAAQPARILLFQRNLERLASDRDSVCEEIARTLHHELAHYLGFEEEDMPGLDLD